MRNHLAPEPETQASNGAETGLWIVGSLNVTVSNKAKLFRSATEMPSKKSDREWWPTSPEAALKAVLNEGLDEIDESVSPLRPVSAERDERDRNFYTADFTVMVSDRAAAADALDIDPSAEDEEFVRAIVLSVVPSHQSDFGLRVVTGSAHVADDADATVREDAEWTRYRLDDLDGPAPGASMRM